MPLAKRTLHSRLLSKPLLLLYMLYSEWMVTEQNVLYKRAQNPRGPRHWAPIDYLARVSMKGFLTIAGTIGGRVVQRLSTRLQMGDERVVAHVE
jgi:hypothetical protein